MKRGKFHWRSCLYFSIKQCHWTVIRSKHVNTISKTHSLKHIFLRLNTVIVLESSLALFPWVLHTWTVTTSWHEHEPCSLWLSQYRLPNVSLTETTSIVQSSYKRSVMIVNDFSSFMDTGYSLRWKKLGNIYWLIIRSMYKNFPVYYQVLAEYILIKYSYTRSSYFALLPLLYHFSLSSSLQRCSEFLIRLPCFVQVVLCFNDIISLLNLIFHMCFPMFLYFLLYVLVSTSL
jgi:hypothetical protein